MLFRSGDWNAKVGSQETPGVTGKFGFGIRNEAGQRLIERSEERRVGKECFLMCRVFSCVVGRGCLL